MIFFAFILVLVKFYWMIKLENAKGRYLPNPIIFTKFIYFPFPYLKSDNPVKQVFIRKINKLTAIFWIIIGLVFVIQLIFFAFTPFNYK